MPETVPLTLPAMGESVTEGTVVNWVKQAGDPVTEGETVVEVTTDKVDIEVPAPASGTLAEITAPEGETVPVGGTLGLILAGPASAAPGSPTDRESSAPPSATPAAPVAPVAPPPKPVPAPEPERPAPAAPAPVAIAPNSPAAAAPRTPQPAAPAPPVTPALSPLARRRAALTGVDVTELRGSGAGGVIRRADLYGDGAGAAAHPAAASAASAVTPVAGEVATPIRGPHAALVEAMERSRDIPTATSIRTIPVSLLDTRRRQLNAALGRTAGGLKVSYTHLIGYALARAAAEMPGMLAHFARDADGKPLRVEGASTSVWRWTPGARTAAASWWCPCSATPARGTSPASGPSTSVWWRAPAPGASAPTSSRGRPRP